MAEGRHHDEFYERKLKKFAPNWEEHLGDCVLLSTLLYGLLNNDRSGIIKLHKFKGRKPRAHLLASARTAKAAVAG